MENKFLSDEQLPFCKGCGHTSVNTRLETALQKMGYSPLDVVIVTDIGCHGIIDKNLHTHTVHGLHGRSVAVASGIAAAMAGKKKVIVMVGDGGATMGMQHLIDAAHRNFDMTVLVLNNMLYGMTGGQPSEFTPHGFKTPTNPDESVKPYYNLCPMMVEAGASFVSRINGIGDFSDHLVTAISRKGFSVVEIMEICTSYGVKSNPGMKLARLVEGAALDVKVYTDVEKPIFNFAKGSPKPVLIDEKSAVEPKFEHYLQQSTTIMIYGSAGGGVQLVAELLAKAGLKAGLQVSKKGSYPVTIGIGFSTAEVILSPEEIHFTGAPDPDHAIILTEEGKNYGKDVITSMKKGALWVDSAISLPPHDAATQDFNFTERKGVRNAAMYSVFYMIQKSRLFQMEALTEAYNEHKISKSKEVSYFLDFE